MSTSATEATMYTSGVMLHSGGQIAFSEYAAENNDFDGTLGCGDGYVGRPVDGWACLYDEVGRGFPRNGHGRGMSQWSSKRWADRGQSWSWITNHYYNERPYPKFDISSPLAINSASPNPSTVPPGGSFSLTVNTTNFAQDPHSQILIGASLCAPSCTISDPAHDTKVTINPGTSNVSRLFQVPATTTAGTYDLLVAFWFDINENGRIDPQPVDLILVTKIIPAAVTVGSATLTLSVNQSAFHRSQQLTLGTTVTPGSTSVVADVYVALQLPDGSLLFLQGDGSFTWSIQPIVRNWTISPFTGQIFTYTFSGGEPAGNYAWLAAFAQPGTLNFIGPIVSAPFSFSP